MGLPLLILSTSSINSHNFSSVISFKYLGSYKSTNLAVSEHDKQDIEWGTSDINNDLFD